MNHQLVTRIRAEAFRLRSLANRMNAVADEIEKRFFIDDEYIKAHMTDLQMKRRDLISDLRFLERMVGIRE
jgi:hypothetical protein